MTALPSSDEKETWRDSVKDILAAIRPVEWIKDRERRTRLYELQTELDERREMERRYPHINDLIDEINSLIFLVHGEEGWLPHEPW